MSDTPSFDAGKTGVAVEIPASVILRERQYALVSKMFWRNLIEPSFGTLKRPENLNIAGEDHEVGDEGADDEHHLNI